MLRGKKIFVVLPAYNAVLTLAKTVAGIDRDIIDEVLVVDDASTDETAKVADNLGLLLIRHQENRGYGGNQKTCYAAALMRGADVVVMLHPDYQYSPALTVPMASMIAYDAYDFVLGSRVLAQNAVEGGMPHYKYFSNRALTFFENVMTGAKLSEFHTGLRAYSRSLLESLRLEENSDDFVFDNEVIAQALMIGARIGEISCPTRYDADSSSINLKGSVRYGLGVLRTSTQFRLQKAGLRRYGYLGGAPLRTDSSADFVSRTHKAKGSPSTVHSAVSPRS